MSFSVVGLCRALPVVLFLVGAVIDGLLAAPLPSGPDDSPQDNERIRYIDYAELDFGSRREAGTDSGKLVTGFTLVRLETPRSGSSRLVISAAFQSAGLDEEFFRVLARDRDGKLHRPICYQGTASGQGTKYRVVTFVCEFAMADQEIEKIVIQRVSGMTARASWFRIESEEEEKR